MAKFISNEFENVCVLNTQYKYPGRCRDYEVSSIRIEMRKILQAISILVLLGCVSVTNGENLEIAVLNPYQTAMLSGNAPYAIDLALKHIKNNSTILENYNLTITIRDSGCSNVIAVKSLFEFIRQPDQNYLVLLGAWCSLATAAVAELAIEYDLPVISWASTSPALTNSLRYPQLILGTPSDINTVSGQVLLIQQYKIKRVAIINEQEDLFVSLSTRVQGLLTDLDVEYITDIYNPLNADYLDSIDLILSRIETEGYRAIILNGREVRYVQILCQLKKYPSLHPPVTTWIILGWYTEWSDNVAEETDGKCTFEDIVALSSGSLAVNPSVGFAEFNKVERPTVSGYTPRELYEMYEESVVRQEGREFFERETIIYDPYAYDCTWTIALGLNKLAMNSSMNMTSLSSSEIFNAMTEVSFNGWTGDVYYVDRVRPGSRVLIYEIINGSYVDRGLFVNVPANLSELVGNQNVSYEVITPFSIFNPDTVTDGIEEHYIHTAIFVLTVVFSFLGMTYITVLIVIISVGWIKRYAAVTKSEPSVNIVIISGNYAIFILALLWSIDGRYIQVNDNQPVCTFVCHFRIWLLVVSISIIFGGMLGKAIKYYIIAIKHEFKYADYLKFYQILLIPLVLVLVDTVYVLIWALASPITYVFFNMDSNLQNPPIYRVAACQPENTTSFLVFLSVIIVYKSILVLIGLFLAYHLRKVVNKANKYSSTITWTMYNVLIFSILQVVLILTLEDVDIKYGLVCLSTILEGFAISSIVAGPILYYLYKDPKGKTFKPTPTREEFPEDTGQLKDKIRNLESQNIELKEKVELSGALKQSGYENPSGSVEEK